MFFTHKRADFSNLKGGERHVTIFRFLLIELKPLPFDVTFLEHAVYDVNCYQLVKFPGGELLHRGIKEALRKVVRSERRLCRKMN